MAKFAKMGTAQLLKKLENQQGSHEELADIKAILVKRNALVDKAARADVSEVDALLASYNLDWEIQLEPLTTTGPGGEIRVHPTLSWPVRQDVSLPLGRFGCKADKPLLQNRDLLELGLRLAGATGSEVTFAKVLDEGASVLISIKLGRPVEIGTDKVQRYVYILDNRTGEHGLRVGFGETTLRCTNQLRFVSRNAAHTIRHTKTLRDRIEALVETYDQLGEEVATHHLRCKLLREYPMSVELSNELITTLTGCDLTNVDQLSNKRTPAGYRLATMLQDAVAQECTLSGMNLWGFLQAVTWVTTHQTADLYPRSEAPTLDDDLAYGKGGELSEQAYQLLSEYVAEDVRLTQAQAAEFVDYEIVPTR